MSPTFDWIWKILLSLLMAGNIYWIKRWINKREKWEEEHTKDHAERLACLTEAGNVVTRDKFFEFCNKVRSSCEIIQIGKWRDTLLEKGGVFTKDEAYNTIERITKDILSRIEGLFHEHDKRAETNLKAIRDTIDGNAGKLDLVIQRQKEVVQRIDHHIDTGHD